MRLQPYKRRLLWTEFLSHRKMTGGKRSLTFSQYQERKKTNRYSPYPNTCRFTKKPKLSDNQVSSQTNIDEHTQQQTSTNSIFGS